MHKAKWPNLFLIWKKKKKVKNKKKVHCLLIPPSTETLPANGVLMGKGENVF